MSASVVPPSSGQMGPPQSASGIFKSAAFSLTIPADSCASTMTDSSDFKDALEQQADIVRIVGDYVKLKKAGAKLPRPLSLS